MSTRVTSAAPGVSAWLRVRGSWTESTGGDRRPAGTAGVPEPHRGPLGPAGVAGQGGGAGGFVLPPGCGPAGATCAPAGASSGLAGLRSRGRCGQGGSRGICGGRAQPVGFPGGGGVPGSRAGLRALLCLVLAGWRAGVDLGDLLGSRYQRHHNLTLCGPGPLCQLLTGGHCPSESSRPTK